MPPKNRNKFGLTIPVDPRWKSFENQNQAPTTSSKPQRTAMRSPRNTNRSPRPPTKPAAPLEKSETEELQRLEDAPPFWKSSKTLSKQMSMVETSRDLAWEKRRRQVSKQEKRRNSIATVEGGDHNLTDEDLNELRGSIELGFGFSEEDASKLSETLPALDLYFAVNRQLSLSPVSTPRSRHSSASSTSLGSPTSLDDAWRICAPGDSPKQVKTKLRHWAQAVACSVMQSL